MGGGLAPRRSLGPPPTRAWPGETAGMGADNLKSSDPEHLLRAPGHPPGQVQPLVAANPAQSAVGPSPPHRKLLLQPGRP